MVNPRWLPSKEKRKKIESHEALCLLNASGKKANVELKIYFEDREPIDGFEITIPPRRTIHYILDNAVNKNGDKIPINTPYAVEVISEINLGVQFTRVDTRQPNMALFTTIAERLM
jgi:hypothetical protein